MGRTRDDSPHVGSTLAVPVFMRQMISVLFVLLFLMAAPVYAAPGGLGACQSQLNVCNGDLFTCQDNLSACQANLPLPINVAPELRAVTTVGTPVKPVRVTSGVVGVSEYVMHDPGTGQWDWHVRRISPGVWDVSFTPITVGTFKLTLRVRTATQIYEQPFVVEVR